MTPKQPQRPALTRLRSAGGVVARGRGDDLRVAVMRSHYDTWVLPKGGIEVGEDPEQAARREIAEEIGLTGLQSLGPLGWTEHEFDLPEGRCRKRVDWFLFTAPPGAVPTADPAHNVLDCGWFTPRQALSLLSHPNHRRLLRRALSRLPPIR